MTYNYLDWMHAGIVGPAWTSCNVRLKLCVITEQQDYFMNAVSKVCYAILRSHRDKIGVPGSVVVRILPSLSTSHISWEEPGNEATIGSLFPSYCRWSAQRSIWLATFWKTHLLFVECFLEEAVYYPNANRHRNWATGAVCVTNAYIGTTELT